MSHRIEQLESTLLREVTLHLEKGLADPRVQGLITVTGVKLTEDRRTAVVSVSVLPAECAKLTLHGLRHARKHIHAAVSKRVAVRQMPHLEFKLDDSVKKQSEVIAAINEAMAETGEADPPSPSGDGAAQDRETDT